MVLADDTPPPLSGRPLHVSDRHCHLLQVVASAVKDLLAMRETQVQSLGWEDPLEGGHSNPVQCSCLETLLDSSGRL